jgi:hypothetical protein
VVPDGWVDLTFSNHQFCIAFELDRDTVAKKDWLGKIAAYSAYIKGPYQLSFGVESLTIAVVTTSGERRLRELVSWSEEAIASLRDSSLSEVLFFSAFDPATIEPQVAFYSPIFRRPNDPHPVSLLEIPN